MGIVHSRTACALPEKKSPTLEGGARVQQGGSVFQHKVVDKVPVNLARGGCSLQGGSPHSPAGCSSQNTQASSPAALDIVSPPAERQKRLGCCPNLDASARPCSRNMAKRPRAKPVAPTEANHTQNPPNHLQASLRASPAALRRSPV